MNISFSFSTSRYTGLKPSYHNKAWPILAAPHHVRYIDISWLWFGLNINTERS